MADWKAEPASGSEYDVFLNFRGVDTRYNFTDFLYDRLKDAGVRVFMDEEELPHGDVISDRLQRVINRSILYVPIFSPNYASSKWCLRELKLMVDNVDASGGKKSILPIFLLVKPDDLKFKTQPDRDPLYKAAFVEHEKSGSKEVDAWKIALGKVDERKGWVVGEEKSQAVTVKAVVQRVLEKLKMKKKSVTEHVVGVDDRVKDLMELLDVDLPDARLIVIYGMGGIGKTTVAKVIFNKINSQFGKRCSFLHNVRESSSTEEGIVQLQKQLLSDIVDSESASNFRGSEQGKRRIGETLPTEKVFVVLDDVHNKEHIKILLGNSPLHPRSRIIITTREKMQVEGFEDVTRWYDMPTMDDSHALELFCWHAFGTNFPRDDFCGFSSKIVPRMGGLPLAIEVTGSLLKGQEEEIWKETLDKLGELPDDKILEVMQISYDDLKGDQKQIFLDIACFLVNEKKTDAIYMWNDRGVYPEKAIKVLTKRCLIKILKYDKFWMHDQLISLARHIVHQESQGDLKKQSRLWIAEEALQIIGTKEMKPNVQALLIDGMDGSVAITNKELERLPNLRFLKLRNGTFVGDFEQCCSKLKWISWHPPEEDFCADNLHFDDLVVFKLHRNVFKDDSKAWDLIKRARDLKVLSFVDCIGIKTILDISKCSSLERLTLEYCPSLERIESFIGNLQSLIELRITKCKNLTDLPEEIGALVKLKHFSLQGCLRLCELPGFIGNLTSLTELDLSEMGIMELPKSIEKLKSLRILRFKLNPYVSETRNWQFPSGISTLLNLEELDLSGHNEMKGQIPVGIGELSSLRILNLKSTGICGIPSTINRLHQLQTLNLSGCHEIQELPKLPTSLTRLYFHSKSLLLVPNLSNLTNLVELLLSNDDASGAKSNLSKESDAGWIEMLYKLKRLKLDLVKAHAPPELVEKIELDLENVQAPPKLASLSHLEQLVLGHLDLKPLVQLPSSDWSLRKLSTLEIGYCEVVDIPLKGLPQLEKLTVGHCRQLLRLSIPAELTKIQQVEVLWCQELVDIQVMGLLKSLDILKVGHCQILDGIRGLSYLTNLEILSIIGCDLLTTVEGLNELESLKYLDIWMYPPLRSLIKACTLPADCVVHISEHGNSDKDMRWKNFLRYDSALKEPERPFIIDFNLNRKQSGGQFSVTWTKNMYVTPDSVTYEGLIDEVESFGFLVNKMGYKTPGGDGELFIEIRSEEEVKGMVQLASERRSIQLIVDIAWEGAMARGSPPHFLVLFFCVAVFLLLSLILGFPRKIGHLAGVRRFGLCEDFVVIFVLLLFLFLGVKVKRDESCWDGMDPETVAEPFLRFLAS